MGNISITIISSIISIMLAAFIIQVGWDMYAVNYHNLDGLDYIESLGLSLIIYAIKLK